MIILNIITGYKFAIRKNINNGNTINRSTTETYETLHILIKNNNKMDNYGDM